MQSAPKPSEIERELRDTLEAAQSAYFSSQPGDPDNYVRLLAFRDAFMAWYEFLTGHQPPNDTG